MKRLLFLGGSGQQVPALVYAGNKGYYTVLCDYLPDNPGQHYAAKFYCVSTTDKDAVLAVAQRERADGIVAYASDPAAPTAAYVAEKLGLPANPFKQVELLTNKDKFRSFLAQNNFPCPRAGGYGSVEQAAGEMGEFRLPVIIKPVDSSGSKGVSKLTHASDLNGLFHKALAFSRVKRVIIEEFVEKSGYQVAGDGFSVDGKLVFRCFANDHFMADGLNPFVPVSASFPYRGPAGLHDKIHGEIQRLLTLLGMKTGAYNFDIRVDERENIYLMEIGPRNGGNYIPQVIRYATGIDMIGYTIKAAVGENCGDLKMVEPRGCWSYYAVHSRTSGILREIKIKEKVRANHIIESHLNYKAGDRVPAFTGSNQSIGILIMKFDSMEQMLDLMDNPEKWIQVIVD